MNVHVSADRVIVQDLRSARCARQDAEGSAEPLTVIAGIERSWLQFEALQRRHVSKRAAESTFVRLRSRRTQFGAGVRVSRRARLLTRPGDEIILGDGCVIFEGALLATYGGHIRLGTGCTVNPYTVLYGHGGLDIGDHVRIAAHVLVVPANHVFEDPDVPIANQGETRRGIVIEDDVWIGAGAIVLDGVTVGSGAVIGAGSVVTQKIPELAVAVGNPARVVRYRGERQTMPIGRTA